jgi:hypothetical protein
MSELISVALASLPVLALVGLVVEAVRAGRSEAELPPVDLVHRAYGACAGRRRTPTTPRS